MMLPYPGIVGGFASVGDYLIPARGRWVTYGAIPSSVQRLPSDIERYVTLTFSGVHAGSEIRVYQTDLTELAGVESCDADHALSVPYYGAGAAGNAVMIRIVSLAYDVIELPYTIPAASVAIPIQQRLDRWYSNP